MRERSQPARGLDRFQQHGGGRADGAQAPDSGLGGGDWTVETPKEVFPAIQSIYRLIGAEKNVENVHFRQSSTTTTKTAARLSTNSSTRTC